eukprot:CAMPEP_0173379514 /NCGR_PEP_ID=MMETSP1356-20130122/2428_1 /TAXON_ID=77927 ORGANISM="Hemiselmis virescens, Strain PCC157" /NCGR_SAMPLE_ID=MMETSP1356 /ASSEMBLY_ACC=CAM_ASM_000847 /LENGTH=116 /DNA_ID=CAMNT_0014332859 /DNA_START=42 /DNA_END=392 /DNA_ORIENTATION=+
MSHDPTIDFEANTTPKLSTTPESTEFSTTFVLSDEDHTMGNSLRYMLNQNPNVILCGYSVPHPLVATLHLHVQTKNITAWEALKQALRDIQEMCDHTGAVFDQAETAYYAEGGTGH